MKALKIILLILLILTILVFGLLVLRQLDGGTSPAPTPSPAPPEPGSLAAPPVTGSGDQLLLEQAYSRLWSWEARGELVSDGETARQPIWITLLNAEALAGSGAREALQEKLTRRAEQARLRAEIYDETGAYRPELLRDCYEELLQERLAHAEDYRSLWEGELRWTYDGEAWTLQTGPEELYPFPPEAEALFAAASAELEPLPLRYPIPEEALWGNPPDERGFLVTEDPAEVLALLEKPEAKALIGGETLLWSPELPFVPGTPIRCYLDESLLCLVWQEPERGCMATFAEVFVSDGSQLRRKISSDRPWSLWFETTTAFARDTNAVLAFGGDFYYHDRNCGVSVYQRELIRFRPDSADSCLVTADGDLLFLYRGAELSQAEMEQHLREEDVVFSLAFGPVLIDGGEDVTPETYLWGEVNDFYARSVLGLLGRHHYLTMNLNCDPKRPELDHLPSLRDAADAMLKRGCQKAYTLDGGRTATTVFHYELVNPVQYGKEIPISDIIYFASGVPWD